MKRNRFSVPTLIVGIMLIFLAASGWTKGTVQAANPALVQTAYADFTQPGANLSGTHVIEPAAGDGAVVLSAPSFDDFLGTSLNPSLWSSYLWPDGTIPYSPPIANSILTIPANANAYVTSNNTFQQPTTTLATTMEFYANFGTGISQHIGFASDKFDGNKYILFSTNTTLTGDLFARLNNNGAEEFADLGPIPVGYHLYRIDWLLDSGDMTGTTDDAIFYIDGSQVASLNIQGLTSLPGLYAYISNAGAAPLNVDFLQVSPPYNGAAGTYTSPVLDAQAGNTFTSVSWNAEVPGNTSLTVETRSSTDQLSWSAFTQVANGGPVPVVGRYIQYRLTLSSSDPNLTPRVDDITLSYGPLEANLAVAKSGPATVNAGESLTYTLSVSNLGPNTASGVTLTDALPAGLTNVTVTGGSGWDCSTSSGLSVSCSLPSLAVGAAPDITVSANAPAEGGQLSNTASVSGVEGDPDLNNNASTAVTTVTPLADLSILMTASPEPVGVGRTLSFTVSVSNLGPSTATNVTVTDTLPSGLVFVSAVGSGWGCGNVSGTVTCSMASLPASSSANFTIQVDAPLTTGQVVNQVSVAADTFDPVSNNNSQDVTVNVIALYYMPVISK